MQLALSSGILPGNGELASLEGNEAVPCDLPGLDQRDQIRSPRIDRPEQFILQSFARHLVRGAVHPGIGLAQPLEKLGVEIVQRFKGTANEEVLLDILDEPFDLSFGPCPLYAGTA